MNPKRYAILLLLACLGCTSRQAHIPQNRPAMEPSRGIASLEIPLPRPSAEGDLAYLGLEGATGPIRMDRIRARALLVEVFDMYCPFCQATAPKLNALFRLISRAGLDGELKVIGVGRMNSPLEVATFKGKYKVPFPLFPDKDLSITRALGADHEGTPHFIVIHMGPPNPGRVVLRKTGGFDDPEAFFKQILHATEVKNE